MTAPISANANIQQPIPMDYAPSFNAVQINMPNPQVDVQTAQTVPMMPETASKQWVA